MALIREIDYGTPKRTSATAVTLEIDGKPITVPAGTSVMRAAAEAGVQVPKLCATDNLEPFGSCRLCLVEIDGRNGTPASCTTPVEAGHESAHAIAQAGETAPRRDGAVHVGSSARLPDQLRKRRLPNFRKWRCAVGLREVRYGYSGANHLKSEKDESNPYFAFDPAKCIVCSRCVRACDEVQGTFALTIDGRGFASKVSAGDKPFLESECVSCGACVQACPTGTLARKIRDRKRRSRSTAWSRPAPTAAWAARSRLNAGRRSRPHDALQGRQGESRPLLREGPLRLGLRHAQGPHPEADDPRQDHRSVARSDLGRSHQPRVPANSSASRPSTGAIRSAASRLRAARTKKPIWSRR